MNPKDRHVTRLPLSELWDDNGPLRSERVRSVGVAEIATVLRGGPIQFAIADCGHPLVWVPLDQCYQTWKIIKPHIVAPAVADEGFRLEDCPGDYCYIASEWSVVDGRPIVLLEAQH